MNFLAHAVNVINQILFYNNIDEVMLLKIPIFNLKLETDFIAIQGDSLYNVLQIQLRPVFISLIY